MKSQWKESFLDTSREWVNSLADEEIILGIMASTKVLAYLELALNSTEVESSNKMVSRASKILQNFSSLVEGECSGEILPAWDGATLKKVVVKLISGKGRDKRVRQLVLESNKRLLH